MRCCAGNVVAGARSRSWSPRRTAYRRSTGRPTCSALSGARSTGWCAVPADFDDTLINGPPKDGPVIDCHCHAGTGDGLTGPWDTAAPLRDYCRRAAAAGIDGTVLFAPFSSDYAAANDQVARIVARNPRRFLGFAFVHPERDRGRIGELVDRAMRRHGFRGIKAHRHDGRLTREVCEVADRWRLPVLYDPMGEIAPIELVATEYPRVAFIVPHLGSFADDWRAQR